MANDLDLKLRIAADTTNALDGLNNVDERLRKVGDATSVWNQELGTLDNALRAGGIALAASEVLQATEAIRKMQQVLDTATGSAEAGAQAWGYVRSEADRLGINLETVANSYANLAATTRGFSSQPETRTLKTGAGSGNARILLSESPLRLPQHPPQRVRLGQITTQRHDAETQHAEPRHADGQQRRVKRQWHAQRSEPQQHRQP